MDPEDPSDGAASAIASAVAMTTLLVVNEEQQEGNPYRSPAHSMPAGSRAVTLTSPSKRLAGLERMTWLLIVGEMRRRVRNAASIGRSRVTGSRCAPIG
jgi:hypothetical protein